MSSELNYKDVTLVLLDTNINLSFDCLETKFHLNTIVNYVKVFEDPNETIDYINLFLDNGD